MKRTSNLSGLFLVGQLLLVGTAGAAGRVVVLPVVLGNAPDPASNLVQALAEGLRANRQWTVAEGAGLQAWLADAVALSPEAMVTLTVKIEEAVAKMNGAAADAASIFEAARDEILAARKTAPLGDKGEALGYRASALWVTALVLANEGDKAKKVAEETGLLFPGRKAAEDEKISPEARALLATPNPGLGGKLTFKTRPEACEVLVGGLPVGKSPVDIAVLPGTTYHAQARCEAAAAASDPSSKPALSFVKRVGLRPDESARQELLDAEFERIFQAEGGARIRFASTAERKQLEESYVRRLAERFDAEAIVLVSVGELKGSDFMKGQVYLRSGFSNRVGAVRLETEKAKLLGNYLATGKENPGVVRPGAASLADDLVAAAPQVVDPDSQIDPWYTDVPAWCLIGAGAVTLTAGIWASVKSDSKLSQSEASRDDFDLSQRLRRQAGNYKFWGGAGLFAGGMTMVTGAVLLAIPEYRNSSTESFLFSAAPGGGSFAYSSRF